MSLVSSAAVSLFEQTADKFRARLLEQAERGESKVTLADLEAFLATARGPLLRELTVRLAERDLPSQVEAADEWTVARRTAANLAAMELLASKPAAALNADDRRVLARYSGWGGLSLDKVRDRFPPSLQIDVQGLIHEYYTPSHLAGEIARVTAPLLPGLVGADGIVRALEPSAGIGRLIRAFDALKGRPVIRWTAAELSSLAARLLAAVRPGLTVYAGPFERWIRDHGAELGGTFNLVACNPPFGERGTAKFDDPDRDYREEQAAAYFVRRSLDVLVPDGLGIFILPIVYLTGESFHGWRERVLVRHHLAAAFRLPSHVRTDDGRIRPLFPGAHNVVDLVFFRRRAGELAAVDEADVTIVEGRYFEQTPGHVLGQPEGTSRWQKIVGPEVRLPAIVERPACTDCRLRPPSLPATVVRAVAEEPPEDEDPRLTVARALGERVARYLAVLSAGGPEPVLLWPELHASLLDWTKNYGNPYEPKNLEVLAGDRRATSGFLRAFGHDGRLIPGLQQAPTYREPYTGAAGDPVALAEHVYRTERGLTIARLQGALEEQGRAPTREDMLRSLYRAGWCVDGPGLQHLLPHDDYLSGDLWARHDALTAMPEHPRVPVQMPLLLGAMGLALYGDLGKYSVRAAWVDMTLLEGFMRDTFDRFKRSLERKDGVTQVVGFSYENLELLSSASAEAVAFLGWLNHDNKLFKPPRKTGQTLLAARDMSERRWDRQFRRWVEADPARQEKLLAGYNRILRGFQPPTYSTAPLPIARWTDDPKSQLHDYQRAAIRRIVDNFGGILSLDLGLGKTFTALGAIAKLRQEGRARRVVVVTPNSLVFQWYAETRRVLPDYRIGIVGAKFIVRQRGERKGETDSATDTPAERAAKWARFQAGEYDIVLLTYSALGRTRIDLEAARTTAQETPAVARKIQMKLRSARNKKPGDRTERENAILHEKTPAWIFELLELPENQEYDGDVVWDDLGIDFLVIDEMHNFKNLFQPEERQRGLPAFMGSGGEGSGRAWQLFFRSAAVRRRSGGAGVLGMTATVAKNGPTELYSAFCYVNPRAWTDLGISDAEAFIDQFCLLEPRPVVTTAMALEERDAMVGFKNLRDLRAILTRYIEFKTSSEMAALGKIKKPRASTELVRVTMNDAQRTKMQEVVRKVREVVHIGEDGKVTVEEQTESRGPDLGMIVRLGLIAIHPQLDEGYKYETALKGGDGLPPPSDVSSPKFEAVAERILANVACGHIVFLEPIAGQVWLREVLVQHGIPRERIALLNAVVAKTAAQRAALAADFNAGKYIVVIANSVAGEGTNLQRRTCAVHNVDIPWDPMTRLQRIGRADRQGNELTSVVIYDYLTRHSGDGPRFDKLSGKGTWLQEVLGSRDEVAINPAAQESLSPIELLADLTGDPEQARRLLEAIQQRDAAQRAAKTRARIARLLRAINDRFRAAEQVTDPAEGARLREEARAMVDDLRTFEPEVWPLADLAQRIEKSPVVVTEDAVILWSGLQLVVTGEPEARYLEVGRVEAATIGWREGGSSAWKVTRVEEFPASGVTAASYHSPWLADDDARTREEIGEQIAALRTLDEWEELGWRWASESWLARHWPQIEPQLRERLWLRGSVITATLPALSAQGELYLVIPAQLASLTLLPPGLAGWGSYVQLAHASPMKFSQLREAARVWWDRTLPPRAVERAETEAEDTRPEPEVVQAPGSYPLLEEATMLLLQHRGIEVEKNPRGGLILDPQGPEPYVKGVLQVARKRIEPRTSRLATVSAQVTDDLARALWIEGERSADPSTTKVLQNLRQDPAYYDDFFLLAWSPMSEEDLAPTSVRLAVPYPQRARVRVATERLLKHRGIPFDTDGGDRLVLDPKGPAPYTKRLGALLGLPEPRGSALANQSADVTRDLLVAARSEREVHGERAFWEVARRLQENPGHYDALFPPPTPFEAPATPPAPAASPTRPPAPPTPEDAPSDLLDLVETLHTQKRVPIWIVRLRQEVPTAQFERLKTLAREHGGFYSRFQSRTVPRGFQFRTRAAASEFMEAWTGAAEAETPTSDPPAEAAPAITAAPAASMSSPGPSLTAPPPSPGSYYQIGTRLYGDAAFLRNLEARVPTERPHPDLIYLATTPGALQFRHFTDDVTLPAQQGPLYEITARDPATDVPAQLGQLWRDGFTALRGMWPTWPSAAA